MSKSKNELDILDWLPRDLGTYLSAELDKTDEPQQFKTGRQQFALFRAPATQIKRILAILDQDFEQGNSKHIAKLAHVNPDYRQRVLFLLAGLGAQDEMRAILQEYPEELLVSRELTDISGAYFPSITLFQHCLWTKDVRYMANMMLDCLPKTVEGEAIRVALIKQYNDHESNGVTYILNGERHEGERHFNLQPLMTALKSYINGYDHWTDEQRDEHWCAGVGMAQRVLPAHIRHHYCDPDEAFCANVNLAKPELTRTLEIYNWLSGAGFIWSSSLLGLGQDFGISGGARGRSLAGPANRVARLVAVGRLVDENLAALSALDEMRTGIDLPALQARLDTPLQIEAPLSLQAMEL